MNRICMNRTAVSVVYCYFVLVWSYKPGEIIYRTHQLSIDITKLCWRPQPKTIRAAITIYIIIFNCMNMLLGAAKTHTILIVLFCYWV